MANLLDTHTLIWYLAGDARRLSLPARRAIERDPDGNFISLVSPWEMAIKVSLGKLHLPFSIAADLPGLLSRNGFRLLAAGFAEFELLEELPQHHRDPFDRMLVAQSQLHRLDIVSADEALDSYNVKRIW